MIGQNSFRKLFKCKRIYQMTRDRVKTPREYVHSYDVHVLPTQQSSQSGHVDVAHLIFIGTESQLASADGEGSGEENSFFATTPVNVL
jgi:hypothetical protein